MAIEPGGDAARLVETMGALLPKLGRKVIVDDKARGVLPLLQLDGAQREVKP